MLNKRMHSKRGFTIIELLIVIVVIAILALITVIVFNGIQKNARNSASIASARQLASLIRIYTTTYNTYPFQDLTSPGDTSVCLSSDNVCTNNSGVQSANDNTYALTELRKVGKIPPNLSDLRFTRADGTTVQGIQLIYNRNFTFNGEPYPMMMEYWLQGTAQNCKMVVTTDRNSTTSTTGFSETAGNVTTCRIALN